MTDTTESTPASSEAAANGARAPRKGLSAMVLPELRELAGGLGIKSTGLRKGELIDAIKAAQSGGQPGGDRRPARTEKPADQPAATTDAGAAPAAEQRDERRDDRQRESKPDLKQPESSDQPENKGKGAPHKQQDKQQDTKQENKQQDRQQDRQQQDRQQQDRQQQDRQGDDEGGSSRRNRRRRGRDRTQGAPGNQGNQGGTPAGAQNQGHQGQTGRRNEPDLQILEDDVLAPCAGILDLMDNYAFVRTSGYLPGPDDVYVSMSMVRKYGLRRGDAVTGQVRQPREGERREKYNPLVKIDSVNGAEPDSAKNRAEFDQLTPLHPDERLRLETSATDLTGRVIDLVAPIGKGQRGLILAPSQAGKTSLLQSIARSITTNNPECHVMVVLVDERPEEVTDFERSVKGEVISSTFDRPPADHTLVAELSIERAKRLVELGHDVVVLVDGITRLGRAYNLAQPSGGRTLAGGVDSAALYPPKRFLGAARNIEDGGSLTILATARVESGSATDEVILDEVRGTANLEIRLRADLAERRIFPAVDVPASGTRYDELLLGEEELALVRRLRRLVIGTESRSGAELLLEQVRSSQNNIELLTQVQRSAAAARHN